MRINSITARHENLFSICNTATLTLILFMLQITKKSKEQYLDTLAACNYDKESSLLFLEFLVWHSHLS